MIKSLEIKQILTESDKFLGQKVQVRGWVRTARSSKNVGFIELNDGSCFKNLQAVFEESLPNFSEIEKVNIGSALLIEGEVVKSPAKEQAVELKAEKIIAIKKAT